VSFWLLHGCVKIQVPTLDPDWIKIYAPLQTADLIFSNEGEGER
jgi:hypothetical protein